MGLQTGDALVTDQVNVALVVRTADCVPILVADLKEKSHRGHSCRVERNPGWSGFQNPFRFCDPNLVLNPETLRVAIGPSIGVCCYEIDTPVIQLLQEAVPSWTDCVDKLNGQKGDAQLKKIGGPSIFDGWCLRDKSDTS